MPWQVWQASSSCTGTVVCRPVQRVLERDPHLDLDVVAALAALLPRPLAAAVAEQAAEHAAEIEVAEVEVDVARRKAAARAGRPFVDPIRS